MPYAKFDPAQLILRDHLAIDRTVLANERTLLAYLRLAILLLISGVTLLKVYPDNFQVQTLGVGLIAVALASMVFGAWRYGRMRRKITSALEPAAPAKKP